MIYHDTGFGWFWATSSYTFSNCLRCSWSFLWEMRGMGPPNQTILEENMANRGQPWPTRDTLKNHEFQACDYISLHVLIYQL